MGFVLSVVILQVNHEEREVHEGATRLSAVVSQFCLPARFAPSEESAVFRDGGLALNEVADILRSLDHAPFV